MHPTVLHLSVRLVIRETAAILGPSLAWLFVETAVMAITITVTIITSVITVTILSVLANALLL